MNRISLTLLAGAAVLSMASASHAADLLIQQPSMPGYVDMGSGGWDGAYVGGFVGFGWGTVIDDDGGLGLDDDELGLSGWTIGATLGANFTVTPGLILGAAGDIAWTNVGGYDDGTDLDFDVNWTGSFRGKAGFDGGAFMPYLTAGVAFAGATGNIAGDESSQVHFGWTAGAGVEVAVADQVSVDLQYRYTDYGTADYDLPTDPQFDLNTHAITAGVNFKF
jgi:opacity protein-like surface antigen